MEENREGAARESIEAGYDKSEVNVTAVLKIGVWIIALAITIHLLIWGVFRYFDINQIREGKLKEPAPLVSLREKLPPEPRIQASPQWDLIQLRQEEEKELNSYGWVDRNSGTVRIPIDKAIDLMIQRGVPVRQQLDESKEKR
jgi:hypothetical protein